MSKNVKDYSVPFYEGVANRLHKEYEEETIKEIGVVSVNGALPDKTGNVEIEGGGASSWNDLEDKPFGEETTYSDTLTWDGDTTGLEFLSNAMAYLVSSAVPTKADFANGAYVVYNGNRQELTASDVESAFDENGCALFNGFAIVPTDNYTISAGNITFPKAGVWIIKATASTTQYVSELTINGYNGFPSVEIKTIDPKYLPENLQYDDIKIIKTDDGYSTDYSFNVAYALDDKRLFNSLRLCTEDGLEVGNLVSVSRTGSASHGNYIIATFVNTYVQDFTDKTCSQTAYHLMWRGSGIVELTETTE